MIEFFVTGDFKVIQSQVYIILTMWVIMILAVCVVYGPGRIAQRLGARRFIPGDSGELFRNWGITGVFKSWL